MKLPMLGPEDKLAEIRHLYFSTTKETILEDLAKALDILKAMDTEEERERATVYMHGLNEMRANWIKKKAGGTGRKPAGKPSSAKSRGGPTAGPRTKTPSRAAAKMAAANPKKKKTPAR